MTLKNIDCRMVLEKLFTITSLDVPVFVVDRFREIGDSRASVSFFLILFNDRLS